MAPALNRRQTLKSTLGWAGAAVLASRTERAFGFTSANERPRMAAIGTGSRWYQKATGVDSRYGSAPDMRKLGDYVAVCDADAYRVGLASDIAKEWTGESPRASSDYRSVIDDPEIDIVHISTPDHWHAKIAIEAMLAGKDVYCEKPMTLTIEEGQLMSKVCQQTGRICQIGTQQRSDKGFLTAIALIQAGRLGEVRKATCSIGGGPTSPEIPVTEPPKSLDWNLWQGPTPEVPFRYLAGDNGETQSWSRCHYEFRWWYEYSGGKLTDWGAHHCDIATWGLGKTQTGPVSVDPVMVKHPVPFREGNPVDPSRYNTATEFLIRAVFADGKEIELRHDQGNGILFEGSGGRIFVNRGRLTGTPVEDLESNPLPDGALEAVYKGRELTDHFRNFFVACQDRKDPISDVHSHHRALSTCHLAGIAARLGRKIEWDPETEQVIGDARAQSFIRRDRRNGFEIEIS
ncbi:Gfo/Idh/MocA family oxidoreductase [Roseiconus nitratireducens]|uniref:Gfo/Idh/MocA family oxidoreductase n=1 Tax=Roseiconus nitratireducens TaxID=2605748 RepID=A0A5M6CYQ9_9BACT|nr:Gfo/Idh/MocA family oxidoreductase [Roseiconus nitratireducens]KAA5538025.1 Gfo/Idh/MocA family oxidoreductase [Roseiconus nitratireducens]